MLRRNYHWIGMLTASLGVTACGDVSSSATSSPSSPADTTASAPTVTIDSTPVDGTTDPFAIFTFSAEGAASFECAYDGGAYVPCVSPYTVMPRDAYDAPIGPGEHDFSVRALDNTGAAGEPAAHTWSVKSVFESPSAFLIPDGKTPDPAGPNEWKGIFRINCDFSHASYDDPIVFPGEKDRAHLHSFYGNMLTDSTSTFESLFTKGDASCQGGALNRSSYWVPAIVAPKYEMGQRVIENGEPAWSVVSAKVGNDDVAHEVFYYSAAISKTEEIMPVPPGLRMIAGDPKAVPGSEQPTSIARWHCVSWAADDATNPDFRSYIPECNMPDMVRFDIFFPSCWNGKDLDSEDHKSHMAYPISDGESKGTRCPDTHPVPVARVSYHYAFPVLPGNADPESGSSRGWRLASDSYEVSESAVGGRSLHGDWFNAWHPEVMEALVKGCIHTGLDCHDGNLANGVRLSETVPGTQIIPAVVNEGLGSSHHH